MKPTPQYILNERYTLVSNKQNTYQCLLCDNDSNEYFTLNEVIFSFLKLFKKAIAIEAVTKKVAQQQGVSIQEVVPIVESFIHEMLGKGIIIPYKIPKQGINQALSKEEIISTVITEKFELIKHLSTNTSIKVYLGKQKNNTNTNKVIIKALTITKKQNALTDFLKEFKILQKFNHLNIVSLIEIGNDYGVVEYFEGKSLSKVVNQAISMQNRVNMVHQLLSAFAYLHKKNYLHGDLHPSNILVNKQFSLKIIDFDLAMNVRAKTSRFGGIREFLAPEIISNDMFDFIAYRPTKRSEVYQLGIMIYFILYAKFPIDTATWKEHLAALNSNQISFDSENQFQQKIDEPLLTLLRKCLSTNPANRPASAGKMQDLLNYI